jgi:hypothetical protein
MPFPASYDLDYDLDDCSGVWTCIDMCEIQEKKEKIIIEIFQAAII